MAGRPAVDDLLGVGAAVICGIVLGIGLGWLVHGSNAPAKLVTVPGGVTAAPAPAPPAQAAAESGLPDKLRAELRRAVRSVAGRGRMEAAVMLDISAEPLTAGRASREMRTWSMIKVVTALTLLEQPGVVAGEQLRAYLEDALVRSQNCEQRAMTLALERRLGGPPSRVLAAIGNTLHRAGATIDVAGTQRDLDGDASCAIPGGLPAGEAGAPVMLLGTTRWRVVDAVRLMHGLRRGIYEPEASAIVMDLLRRPKRASREPDASEEMTVPPTWGAGAPRAFANRCWGLAYKGGWGGFRDRSFLAGQMGTIELPGGAWAAFAVMFHPDQNHQPPTDDPGRSLADSALESAFEGMRRVFQRELGACR
jgi:hypothetical protein